MPPRLPEAGVRGRKSPSRGQKARTLSRLQLHIQRIGVGGVFHDTPRNRRHCALALHYTQGLLFPGERKSMQPCAARVPEAQYEAIQNFITNSPWDWAQTQSRLLDEMREAASGPEGLLIIDDVPLVKKGNKSPGVGRQYCGVLGKVDNCQALVDSVYVLPGEGAYREAVGWCFALDLYLPKDWVENPERCEEAGIPTPVHLREKWKIALEQVDRAREHRFPHRAVLADSGYGDAQRFRAGLRDRREPYVMGVDPSQVRVVPASTPLEKPGKKSPRGPARTIPRLPSGLKSRSPKSLSQEVASWTRIRWGEGTKGPLEGYFTRKKVRVCGGQFPTDEVGWLLLEKTSEGGSRSWICWGLNALSLEELAAMAHRRFLIERFHEEAKMELGLDHFEGRKWRGLNHHLTLVLIAHTFLVKEQLRAQEEAQTLGKTGEKKGRAVLPTLAEMRRRVVLEVAWALVSRVALDPTKKERMTWATAVAHYWAGAG